ncbi:SURF1 family protein [Sphingomonas sp. FW199]|uniref:SURF1 family protein n=1 Tax=Sphingomonas sp. FW199 TaxID=3400217 RepID=UPI003CEF6997
MTARPATARFGLAGLLILLAIAGVALGVWQIQRMQWKAALIASVNARIAATPVAAPGPDTWRNLSQSADAYRRVTATGRYRHERETLVQAVTDRGAGYWVLTPLETGRFTLIVNRGFVPSDRRDPTTRQRGNPDERVTITGLLRLTEPGGGFLRSNDPAANRWFSRDVAAIARARGLANVAPYFIDADARPNIGGYPVGGLTVVRFSDNHLVYALTWFALALGCTWGAWLVLRRVAGPASAD